MIGVSGKDSNMKLQRVAFRQYNNDGTVKNTYRFNINPSNFQENFNARNIFMQTESSIQMQGFGQGLHTITISGTTGVRSMKGSSISQTSGFNKYHELYNMLKEQLQSVHDNTDNVNGTGGGGIRLDFLDYTNEHYYKCELSPDGFQFTQSNNNPLSYFYSINLVVVGNASAPSYSETSWIVLGNIKPALSKKELSKYSIVSKSSQYSKDLYASGNHSNYVSVIGSKVRTSALSKIAKDIENNMLSRGADGMRSPIINYKDNGPAYSFQKPLSSSKIANLYKNVYTGINKKVHIVVGNKNIMDINISSDNSSAWNAYWDLYTRSAGKLKAGTKNGIIDYGQGSANDANSELPDYDSNKTHETLYGSTVANLDLTYYGNNEKIYKQLFGNVLQGFNADEYSNAAVAFKGDIRSTILNYGQIDAKDASTTLPPYQVNQVFSDLYSQRVDNLDYGKYQTMSELFTKMRGGTINNYFGDDYSEQESSGSLGLDKASSIYSVLFGQNLSEFDYSKYINLDTSTDITNDTDIFNSVGYSQISTSFTDSSYGTINNYGQSQPSDYNIDSSYNLDAVKKQIVTNLTDTTWDTATYGTDSKNISGLYPINTSSNDDTNSVDTSAPVEEYVNPNVSDSAVLYAYNEISNILKI